MIIGYARVSKEEQVLDRQLDLLNDYGVETIITEKYTGTKKERPGIKQLLLSVRSGDKVVVESISRLGRSTIDLLTLLQTFEEKGVQFLSVKENMDTSTPTGKAMLQMLSVISELERNLLAERIKEGIHASRKRGRLPGRPRVPKQKLSMAIRMHSSGEYSVKEILETVGISQGTFYRELNRRKLALQQQMESDHETVNPKRT
ncbi:MULTISPECIES: recombinase family protein [Enterococcus]|uniref:recombinase family protein n=1 Tax=Enterococcus TaxID=1350 RepID=UPI000CF07BFC|nr:recombinase family protein [Enterococcus faecium]EGP4892407.1 recombinase family protein [Enterococcus faecium]EGP4915367.1 recombinase family protein [Enterococcus faecium]EGP4917552.1 recombinase family protein [Enterococcus faecium]EGP5338431.1 recombinase family protein [Enterococcus faecium]EGP5559477.1 recombinase family protein [Enterococcus faecium]